MMIDRISMHRFVTPFVLALGLGIFVAGTSARADSAPTRAARLTYLQGTVTVNQAANSVSVPAQLNLPLLAGVQLATGADGQAEVEFEDGSIVRLTPNSALSLDNLAVAPSGVFTTGLSLQQGLAYFELRATPQYLYTVTTGGDVMSPVENATVRVNFDTQPASFAVLDGTAHVERLYGPDSSSTAYQADVRAGESLSDDQNDPTRYFLTQGIAADSWDQWNEDQDQAAEQEAADSTPVRDNYAGADGYGWSDLDANGTWYDVPGQGPVWQPQLAVDDSGFDPYGNGAWVSYPGTGYVWASAYSWGWTPYRCGNWSYFGGFGWGWAPGAGCGGFGWGFAGGGRPVNITVFPTGYRPIRVPVFGGPRPIHPVLPIHTGNVNQGSGRGGQIQRGPRQIAGVTVAPVRPVGSGLTPGNRATGSSLRRDFPVDRTTHAPVLGLASTSPTAVHSGSGGRTNNGEQQPQQNAAPQYPSRGGQQRQSQPVVRPQQPDASPVQRPVQPTVSPVQRAVQQVAPVQQSVPQQQNVPERQNRPTQDNRPGQQNGQDQQRYSPPASRSSQPQPQQPAPQRPSPPQQQQAPPAPRPSPQQQQAVPSRPTYSPPPQQAHPTYSPPPASAQPNNKPR